MLPFETEPTTWAKDGYRLTTAREKLDVPATHAFLTQEATWAPTLSLTQLDRAIAGSLPFTLRDATQAFAGFARVVTDGAVFAYLRDVFVIPEHRGRGLGLWMSQCICEHPDLQTITNWMLTTDNAHDLYARIGFAPHPRTQNIMQRRPLRDKGPTFGR